MDDLIILQECQGRQFLNLKFKTTRDDNTKINLTQNQKKKTKTVPKRK